MRYMCECSDDLCPFGWEFSDNDDTDWDKAYAKGDRQETCILHIGCKELDGSYIVDIIGTAVRVLDLDEDY